MTRCGQQTVALRDFDPAHVRFAAIKAIRKHCATDQGEERISALRVSDRLAYYVSPTGGVD
jgi:hypothetical protein